MSAEATGREDPRPGMAEAARRGDVTIAFTPGQLLLVALGAMLLLRFLRRLRTSAGERRAGRNG